MDFNDLTYAQKAKARVAKAPEDIRELARDECYELTDDGLKAVSDGRCATDCSDEGCDVPFTR